MIDEGIYVDNLKKRRDFFHANFPLKITHKRIDVNSADVLKNSCPVCGYLTLDERAAFEICVLCFWEDDGLDDFEENEESGPNHITLHEGRLHFKKVKRKLLTENFSNNHVIDNLKEKLLKIDTLIDQNNIDKKEIIAQHNEIFKIMVERRIYGLEKLFDNMIDH